jgi:hypothetical protein
MILLGVATFSCYDGVAIGAAHLALAYFGFDELQGVSLVYHIGDVLVFAVDVVELEYAVVGGVAVGAFAVDAFVAFYECFVAVALVSVLFDSDRW